MDQVVPANIFLYKLLRKHTRFALKYSGLRNAFAVQFHRSGVGN